MRIGTWNLDARWTAAHVEVLMTAQCDLWLLTEITPSTTLAGYHRHLGQARMARGQHYAGVLSRRDALSHPDPHPASAAVAVDGLVVCSSVLPWAAKDDPVVWGTGSQGDRTTAAVDVLVASLPVGRTIWGGDFNHALAGAVRHGGSRQGRAAITSGLAQLSLSAPTVDLPHRLDGIRSIDHIAVPAGWTITDARRMPQPSSLSDHDLYIVEAAAR